METNALPRYDASDNPTNCCPRFNPEGWDQQRLHFENKRFVRAVTRSIMHIPINMGRVFKRTFAAIEDAGASNPEDTIVLSRDLSPWAAEHLFSVKKDVPGQQMMLLSGDFLTAVFEGPYKHAPRWHDKIRQTVSSLGQQPAETYFFYTTCPKCAKVYGKNYVVGVAGYT